MITVVFVVAQVMAAAAPVLPPWCAEAARQLESARGSLVVAPATVEALLHILPAAVATRARGDIGREARLSAAIDSAASAVFVACVSHAVDVGDPAAEMQLLLKDPRFAGVRREQDFADQLLDRVWKWLEGLLQSDGMQLFADHTRAFYLGLLAVTAIAVAVHLLRRSRRLIHQENAAAGSRVERQRLKAFAAWRAEALPLMNDDATARQASLCLRAALLARVGEEAKEAVTPSRTTQEILHRLGERAPLAAPALQRFDADFYAGRADKISVRALLIDVDEAAAALLRFGRVPDQT